MMEVTITKKHTEGAHYMSNIDCPLARAIIELHPEYKGRIAVGGDDVQIYEFMRYSGPKSTYVFDEGSWTPTLMYQINEGKIDSVTVKLLEV